MNIRAWVLFMGMGSVFLAGCDGSGQVPAEKIVSEFDKKVPDGSVTLEDWTKASNEGKNRFARGFTEAYLGSVDGARAAEIVRFFDATAAGHQKTLQGKQLEVILRATKLKAAAKAGARLMGWPDPVRAASSERPAQ